MRGGGKWFSCRSVSSESPESLGYSVIPSWMKMPLTEWGLAGLLLLFVQAGNTKEIKEEGRSWDHAECLADCSLQAKGVCSLHAKFLTSLCSSGQWIKQPTSPKQGVHFQETAAVPLNCLAMEAHAASWLCGGVSLTAWVTRGLQTSSAQAMSSQASLERWNFHHPWHSSPDWESGCVSLVVLQDFLQDWPEVKQPLQKRKE